MGNVTSGDRRDSGWHRRAPHEVRLAATEILRVAGISAYHTSVIVDDREYFFDSLGIVTAPPLWSHLAGRTKHPGDLRTEVIEVGGSASSGKALVQALAPYFEKGSYDIFYKNCNSFTDLALYFLTKTRLNGRYNRIERMITATNPVSTSLLNRLFRAALERSTGKSCSVDVYVTNPEAEGFSVEEIMATFDASESESEVSGSESDSDDGGGTCMLQTACCRRPAPVPPTRW